MADFPAGLVWLASYPKSGNTWMRVLLANLLAGRKEPADINRLSDDESLIGSWRFSDDMLIDADLLNLVELERLRQIQCDFVAQAQRNTFFCKTHDQFLGVTGQPVLGTQARSALYLIRDPRDVAISLTHHAGLTLDKAIAKMAQKASYSGGGKQVSYLLGDWMSHVSGWTEQSSVRTLVIRYEDLRRDTVTTMVAVCEFLGIEATDAEIRQAVDNSSLAVLQQQELSKGFQERQSVQKQFFRSGIVGEWREVLSVSQVAQIEQLFAPMMTRFGYDLVVK